MNKKLEQKMKQISHSLHKRDQYMFQVLSASSALGRQMAATSFLKNELKLFSLLNNRHLKQAVKEKDKETNPIMQAHLNRVAHLQIHYASGTRTDIVRRALAMARSEKAWNKAQKRQHYWALSGGFENLVDISRKWGQKRAEKLGKSSVFEAFMDAVDPEINVHQFENLMNDMVQFSKSAMADMKPENTATDADVTTGQDKTFALSKAQQIKLVTQILKKMGVDLNKLDLKTGAHPTCMGSKSGVFMTMAYDEDDFLFAALAAVHEGGHALFRQNMPEAYKTGPAGHIGSYAMDEAMALICENNLGKSKGFANFILKTLKEDCGVDLEKSGLTADKIHTGLNRQNFSMIRTRSGEMEYPLHIALRYKIGRDLMDTDLRIEDMPIKWRAEERRLFSGRDKFVPERAMQDIHWFGGQFGYFPCYLSGTTMAAQIFETAVMTNPEIERDVDQFEPKSLVKWLMQNVYRKSANCNSHDVIRHVTGQNLNTQSYKRKMRKFIRPT